MKKLLIALLAAAWTLPMAGIMQKAAAEEPAPEPDYGYGAVSSISETELIVAEYRYEEDRDVPVTYAIDPAVRLENVASLKEIAAGDIVDVIFVTRAGKRTATSIAAEKPVPPTPIEFPVKTAPGTGDPLPPEV